MTDWTTPFGPQVGRTGLDVWPQFNAQEQAHLTYLLERGDVLGAQRVILAKIDAANPPANDGDRIFREVVEFLRESGRSHAADELVAALRDLRAEVAEAQAALDESPQGFDPRVVEGRPTPDYDPRVDHPERYREGPI